MNENELLYYSTQFKSNQTEHLDESKTLTIINN